MDYMGIHDFLARFQGGGLRQNLYMVRFNFPVGTQSGDDRAISYLCKAASLPAHTIGTVSVPFMGRSIKLAGDRTFEDWTVTLLSDTDLNGRRSFEKWMALMNTAQTNVGSATPVSYLTNLSIDVLDRKGATVFTTEFRACFPTNIGEIQMGYANNDAIAEYTVTFAVNYHVSDATGEL